jgi:hypothetical protein
VSPSERETVPVTFEVVSVEHVRSGGKLLAFVMVDLDIAGIAIRLQGVQVLRRADGALECRAPTFRHPRDGRWLPGLILPAELTSAIAAEVLTAFRNSHGANQ